MQTCYGKFKYKVMPLSLGNATATFQTMMNTILRPLLNQGVVVYLNNMLIYTKTMKEHHELVTKVFTILQNEGQAVATHKPFFLVKEVEFLDYIINVTGVEMSNRKGEVFRSWETSKNLKDVQHFLGFENFYLKFKMDFSGIARPITDPTHNNGLDFHWRPLQVV
jgi:hypothetical protein